MTDDGTPVRTAPAAAPTPTRRAIRITIPPDHLDTAEVDAAVADVVEPLVSFASILFEPDATGAIVGRRVTESLGCRDGDVYRFPAKLAPLVAVALQTAGHEVVCDLPLSRLIRPDLIARATVTAVVADWFRRYETWGGGLFLGDHGLRPLRDIPEILRLYPRARVVVAVANRRLVRWWVEHLRAAPLPQRVVAYSDLMRGWGAWPKVLVTSFSHLDQCQRQDFDIAIIPDADPLRDVMQERMVMGRHGLRPTRAYRLLRRYDVPAFGFLRDGDDLSRGEKLRLLSMFGRFYEKEDRGTAETALTGRSHSPHTPTGTPRDPGAFDGIREMSR